MSEAQQRTVVMGGSSGIGLACVERLALAGHEVIATGRDGAKLQRALAGHGEKVRGVVLDGTQPQAVRSFFSGAGGIDHLVICLSGAEGGGEFATLDLQALRRGFEAKFWPHIEIAHAAIPTLSQNGSITFITAVSAKAAVPGTSGLAAINGAINCMIPPLARELKPIRVNAVSPGVIDTPWWNGYSSEAKAAAFQSFSAMIPAGRVGKPDEVARAVQHFVENGYVTGAVLVCDGGLRLMN